MIILDEKMPPPPPYAPPAPGSGVVVPPPSARRPAPDDAEGYVYPPPPPPFPSAPRTPPRLDTLPPHLLLRIVYATFTEGETDERGRERERKNK